MEQMAGVELREADTKEKFIEIVKAAAASKSLSPLPIMFELLSLISYFLDFYPFEQLYFLILLLVGIFLSSLAADLIYDLY